jgi:DNA-binding transcriptional MerR regulator
VASGNHPIDAPTSGSGYHLATLSSGFSTQDITRMLGVSPARLRTYVKAGLLCPQRGESGELRFSFQDLLLMRTAEGLVTERLPPRRIRSALVSLRERLPRERPLTGVQLATVGKHVVVHDDGMAWQADSGQVLLSFDESGTANAPPPRATGVMAPFERARKDRAEPGSEPVSPSVPPTEGLVFGPDGKPVEPTATDMYQLGCNLEEVGPEAARVAYQRALALQPDFAEAHVNLGRLLHESGDLPFAEQHYRAALLLRPGDATAQFNLGVVLEDLGRSKEALEMYEVTVRSVPSHADAHFNAARLYDRAGQYEAALRHLRAYKLLTEA